MHKKVIARRVEFSKHPAKALQLMMWRINRHPTPGGLDINDSVITMTLGKRQPLWQWIHPKRLQVTFNVIIQRQTMRAATIGDQARLI